MVLHRIVIVSVFAVSATAVLAQTASPQQSREIPAYTLPMPEDISPQMRALVAAPPAPWDIHPKSIAEWKELVAKVAAPAKTLLPAIQNAELKDLVTKVAPAFVAHRDAAKNLLDKQMMSK